MNTKKISLSLIALLFSVASLCAQAAPRSVAITANDTMKFSVTSFTVKPGELVHVEFKNEGNLAKDVMGHNWILLIAGKDGAAYSTAAASAKGENYEPKALVGDVLARIGLLGPKQTGEITFTAPTTTGNYVYLCSFPAHFQVGMHGVMTVK
jgi:azurin